MLTLILCRISTLDLLGRCKSSIINLSWDFESVCRTFSYRLLHAANIIVIRLDHKFKWAPLMWFQKFYTFEIIESCLFSDLFRWVVVFDIKEDIVEISVNNIACGLCLRTPSSLLNISSFRPLINQALGNNFQYLFSRVFEQIEFNILLTIRSDLILFHIALINPGGLSVK